MQRENRETRGKARPSGESREAERRREISSEYDRYRAAYASRARNEEAPDLTRREERTSARENPHRTARREAEPRMSRDSRTAPRRETGSRPSRAGAALDRMTRSASRREQAMKTARLRMAGLAAALFIAVGGSIYGIAHLVSPADADTDRGSSSMASDDTTNIADAGTGAPDITSSATVTALSGTRLETVVAQRLAASADNVVTEPGSSGSQTAASNWGTFDPSTVGSSGKANIASWKAKNSDVVGWLRIPNTNINYPVVVGPDNLYYSAKGYDKNYSYYGVIWADSDTKFGTSSQISQNTVLYGHNWTNCTANPFIARASDIMFGQLPSFHYLNFCKSTPYIHYSTESEEMTWKVFAVFYTEESFNYIVSDPGASGLQYIINEAKARSLHDFAVDVNSSDKILTLSTCTRAYGQTSQQRFVVMARLMRPGETITEVSITPNTDFKRPQL